jgi:hypothetical protein
MTTENDRPRRVSRRRLVVGVSAATLGAFGALATIVVGSTGASAEEAMKRAIRIERSEADAQIAEQRARAGEKQRDAFADGRLDLAEYRAAVGQTMRCLQQGFNALPFVQTAAKRPTIVVHGPNVSEDAFRVGYTYTIDSAGVAPDPAHAEAVSALEIECQGEHQKQIELAYRFDRLGDGAFVDRVVAGFMGCANNAGLREIGDAQSDDEIVEKLVEIMRDTERRERLVPCLDVAPSIQSGLAMTTAERNQ